MRFPPLGRLGGDVSGARAFISYRHVYFTARMLPDDVREVIPRLHFLREYLH
jgi:hypothetical protein